MIQNLFGNTEIIFAINLVICIICGYLIGSERESRGKDAGISTHTLVILGSMVFTYMSFLSDSSSPARIAAQIVTGIGFLGAGLIIKDGLSVKNLTTAASIWFAASIGMSIGFGYYIIGILSTIAAIYVPRIPKNNFIFKEMKNYDNKSK